MKKIFRAATLVAAAALSVASLAMFAGCTTNEPEVTITYEFNGEEYEVQYKLTRVGAPQTVQHFIELADAGYYENTVIHDYQDGLFLYGGGYQLDANGEIEEIDYWSRVKKLEEEGNSFTQTVYTEGRKDPLYTVHGEFSLNGVETTTYSHTQGALVMYYSDKGTDTTPVGTIRSDGGENNNGEEYQEGDYYKYNSAGAQFYTFTSPNDRYDLNSQYCVFGMTKDFDQMQALLDAIVDYSNSLSDEQTFTTEQTIKINLYDPIDLVRSAGIKKTFQVPIEPIVVKSVKVDKY